MLYLFKTTQPKNNDSIISPPPMDKNPETHLNKITLAKKDVKINNLQTKTVVSL